MSCGSEYAPELRSRGFRVTAQRMAVLHVLRHSRSGLSPAEVFERARLELPGLTETTVYRTLDFLTANGLVWPMRRENGHLAYELAGEQHHHLVCRRCGRDIELEHSMVKNLYAKVEAASGFHVAEEHLTLFGVCPQCQKPSKQRKRG